MLLPALLPEELKIYSQAESEIALFQMLTTKPQDLILFFEYACDDETWSENCREFMPAAMEWFTEKSLQERLASELLQRVAASIKPHYLNLKSYIPRNLIFDVQSKKIAFSSLLFAASSEVFHNLIRSHLYADKSMPISLGKLPLDIFDIVEEFVYSGDVVAIWKYDELGLLRILRHATDMRLVGLMQLCEDTLKRYINKENVLDLLIKAHKKSWIHLKNHCCHFLNILSWGVKFEDSKKYRLTEEGEKTFLALEFLEFSDTSLDIFERLKLFITHLILNGSLTEETSFSMVIQSCPNMRFLDIGRTRAFSERLYEINPNLQELDLSNCLWLTNDYLKKVVEICPNLRRLVLTSNVQLTFLGWSVLQKLPLLYGLDISRCHQVHDDDLLLILRACPQLTELDLEECRGLSERAFFDLAKSLPHLVVLNVSRCHISDVSLIEIALRCRHLRELLLMRCKGISEKGLLQLIANAPLLKLLDITSCNIALAVVESLKHLAPP